MVFWAACCAYSAAAEDVKQHAGHFLGTVSFPITCSEQAQTEFNRAVALLHHMTYPLAREAFERVATIDRRCAMAHWGIAMTLFQPLWPTRPGPDALQRGWEAVQKAKSLEPPTERERLFVATGEAFFLEPASSDYWARIRRWEQAAERVYAAFPDDSDAAAFYALALLATAPSNATSRAHADRAAEILLQVYRRNPDHPGAMHYLVHANDVPGRERESLEITRKYDVGRAAQPACAAHADAYLYPPRRLERGDSRQPAGGGRRVGVSGGRARRVRVGRVPSRDRIPRVRVPPEGRGRSRPPRRSGGFAQRLAWNPRSRWPFTWHRHKRATPSNVAPGTKRHYSLPANPQPSTGTVSHGPKPSRASPRVRVRRTWAISRRPATPCNVSMSSKQPPAARARICLRATSRCFASSSQRGSPTPGSNPTSALR